MGNTTYIRPKCKLSSEIAPANIIEELKILLSKTSNVKGKIIDNQIYLMIPKEEQHYWSPEFRVTINEDENGSLIKGIAGPNGKVWATFIVFYGLAIMLLIFGGSLGISEWMLDIDSVWIWSIPVSLFLYILIVIAAKYGQKLGNNQLIRLRYFLDEAIARAENKKPYKTKAQ